MKSQSDDAALLKVAAFLKEEDPNGERFARVFRETIDQLYDGQRTGRYHWAQLFKTEKTHCGTLVEINLQREFEFQDGNTMDFRIAGAEVDCKFSQKCGSWMIPPEAIGHLCLLAWAEDSRNPRWSVGLVRITPDLLTAGGNRDGKKSISRQGREAIRWLWRESPLQPNVLIQADPAIVSQIFAPRSGMERINQLFRLIQGKIISRTVVATVNQGSDYMKRIRANGGARSHLQKEGIIILGQYRTHLTIARNLGLPVPGKGDSVSIRVAPAKGPGEGKAQIGNAFWRVAEQSDPVTPAPECPCK